MTYHVLAVGDVVGEQRLAHLESALRKFELRQEKRREKRKGR